MATFEETFSEEYRSTLREIADNFKNNLTYLIQSDTERYASRRFDPKNFEAVACVLNGHTISLENLKLMNHPVFTLHSIDVDFKNLCLPVKLTLNDVNLEAAYQLKPSEEATSNEESGKLKIILSGTVIEGKVSLFTEQDSFMPIHYDTKYEIGKTTVEAKPENAEGLNDVECETIANRKDIGDTLLKLFWLELYTYLSDLLHRIIAGNVVEYSLSELLVDNPNPIRKYQKELKKVANARFDEWLKTFIEQYNNHPENATSNPMHFNLKTPQGTCKISWQYGQLHSIPTLKRFKDVSTFKEENSVVHCAHVKMEDFNYVFEGFKASLNNQVFQGTLKLSPRYNKMLFKITKCESGELKLEVELLELIGLDVSQEISADVAEAYSQLSEYWMPFLIAFTRVNTNAVLQVYVNNFNTNN